MLYFIKINPMVVGELVWKGRDLIQLRINEGLTSGCGQGRKKGK